VSVFAPKDITIDNYLAVRRQLGRWRTNRLASLSPLAVLLRGRETSEEWPLSLAQAERVAEMMTPGERRDPTRLEDSRREELASRIGVRREPFERLIDHFGSVRETARGYQRTTVWRRLRLLMREDPLIGWIRLRFDHRDCS
jgi:signal recognition particle GTPase